MIKFLVRQYALKNYGGVTKVNLLILIYTETVMVLVLWDTEQSSKWYQCSYYLWIIELEKTGVVYAIRSLCETLADKEGINVLQRTGHEHLGQL
jgi:hypothetical protein